MRTEDVIDGAPWVSGLGAWLIVESQFAEGTVSSVLNMAGLVVSLLALGALLAHYPSRPAQRSGLEASRLAGDA